MFLYRVARFSCAAVATLLSVGLPDGLLVATVMATAPSRVPIRADAYGDPLPPGALLRLGTVRWRTCAQFLAFTPDGKTLVTGENYPTSVIRCWDASTGKETGGFSLDHRWSALALSPDGKTLALNPGRDAKGVVLVRLSDGKEVRRFEGECDVPVDLQFSPDGKKLSALDEPNAFYIFDVESGKSVFDLTEEPARFQSSAFSPDGTKLAFVLGNQTLRVLEIPSKKELFNRPARMDAQRLADVKYSPDGKKLAWAGGKDRIFTLLDAATGEPVLKFRGSPGNITSVHFSPNGKRIATTDDKSEFIRLWDAETGEELRRINAHSVANTQCVFSPDGGLLASAEDWQGVIHLWDAATGRETHVLGEQQGPILFVDFSLDARTAVTGCADGEVRIWDVDKGIILRRVKVADGVSPFCKMATSKDQTTVAVRVASGSTDLYDLASSRQRTHLEGGEEAPWTAAFAPDGKTLAANGFFEGLRLWDAKSGKMISRLATPKDASNDFTYAPDGKTLAVSCIDPKTKITTIAFLETRTGKELCKWRLPNSALYHLCYSSDGRILAAAGAKEARLWDAARGKEMPPLILAEERPTEQILDCLAFSPDGKTLAAGAWFGKIYLWEVATTKMRAVLTGHRAGVTSLDFSSDGSRLLSGSSDTTALIWDLTGIADEKGVKSLPSEKLAGLWDELADADAGKAWHAGWRLVADPTVTVAFLQKSLHKAEVDAAQVAKLLAALDSDAFIERESATAGLAKLDDLAEPAMRKFLSEMPSKEATRRLQELVNKLDGPVTLPDQVRDLRCVEVLEHIGTAEARRLLDELAKGAEGARLTREAKAALARLAME